MANSIITRLSNGSDMTFSLNFTLGILNRDDVVARVGDEVDGGGNPVYRTIEWITDGLVTVQGAQAPNGTPVTFTRTVKKDQLQHDYANGVPIEEKNLDESNKQALMAVHEVLDGRFPEGLAQDLNMNGFKVINMANGTAPTDAVNLGQISGFLADSTAQAERSKNWAIKTDGIVEAIDYSSKAWAIGGTGVPQNAKAWAISAAMPDGLNKSAKSYAADAGSSAASAADALAQVLALYDEFDDRYLGAKTVDPTTDNDGNPLFGGALYFNEVQETMKVYTGSIWVAAYVPGTDFLTRVGNLSDLQDATTALGNLGGTSLGISVFKAASAAAARTALGLSIGSDVQAYNANTVFKNVVTDFTAQQNVLANAITSSGNSLPWDLSTHQVAKHTFTENTTLANPSNMKDGGTYILNLVQSSPARTLAFGTAYKFPGGTVPAVSTSDGAKDVLTCVSNGTDMMCVLQKDFK